MNAVIMLKEAILQQLGQRQGQASREAESIMDHGFMDDFLINDVMVDDVACTRPDTPLREVVSTMSELCISCMVVTDNMRPIGVVTERDLTHFLAGILEYQSVENVVAADVMSRDPITLSEGATVTEALVIARARKIRHIPVVGDSGELIGLITQSDLVKAHFKIIEQQREIIDRAVTHRTRELEEANETLKELSMEDALTEIGNRRAMEVDLNHTHATAIRYKRPYSVIMFDLDYFKKFNDSYGHASGDDVLVTVAALLKESVRGSDRVYRYGGEEMLILLSETRLEGAVTMARRIVETMANKAIPNEKSDLKILTLSGGVACVEITDDQEYSWRDVVKQADQALYKAKENGRNQVALINELGVLEVQGKSFSNSIIP